MSIDPHSFYHPDDGASALHISHGGHTMGGIESGTWQAYRVAHERGFRAYQVDLVATGDDRLVSRHTIFGRVRRWERQRAAELDRLLGEERPTLDELLETWPDDRWNIEIKSARCLDALSAAIARHPHPERLCVSAPFHTGTLRELRRRHPGLATNASLTEGALLGVPLRRLGDHLPTGIQLFAPVARPRIIARWARAVAVQVWPVNDAETATRFLGLGVGGFVVDDLDAVRAARKPSGNS